MDKFYTYILYSKELDKFYTGATKLNPVLRKTMHLIEYYGCSKYTAKVSDWILFFEIECTNYTQALKIENHIKRMKSKLYIRNLIKYPEMATKLQEKYT